MMFQNWNFLILEIWALLLLAGLVGLIAGAIIFKRGKGAARDFETDQALSAAQADLLAMRKQLDAAEAQVIAQEGELSDLRALAAAGGMTAASAAAETLSEVPADMPEDFAQFLQEREEHIAHLESALEDLRAELETDASSIEARFEEMTAELQDKDARLLELSERLAAYEMASGTDPITKAD